MKEEIIHKYAVDKLERWLSLWERGELPDSGERELSEFVGSLRESEILYESVAESLSPDLRETLSVYSALEDLKLTDSESERLESAVASAAAEERKWMKRHDPRRNWLLRLSIIASAACVLLLIGVYVFIDKDIHFGKEGSQVALFSDGDSLDSQVSKMMAMESGKSSLKTVMGMKAVKGQGPGMVNPGKSRHKKIKKNKKEVIESDWDICKRLLKEMDLNSGAVSRDALIMLNNDFEGDISTKVVVSGMLREMGPLNIFTM